MTHSLDLSCSCGATMHYVGDSPAGQRAGFLTAHESCRAAVARSDARPGLQLVDAPAVQRSLLKLKRRNGGLGLGLS